MKPPRTDTGQSSVEAALVLPVVVLGLSVVLQAGLIVRDQVLVTHSAREGARVAAVEADADAAAEATLSAAGLDAGRLTVEVEGSLVSGERVRIEVIYRSPIVVPLLNTLVDDIDLTAAVTIRVE
ncbi:MAG TPA: TadE/TadG family type IV pilus assembly protein [Acidimicrobiales bacterium]|nr:TadE/TadG family type IV pilus assembly protein [Acidimicrobiales bacterium]